MDFTNRAGRPAQPNQQVVSPSTAGGGSHQGGGDGGKKKGKMSLPFSNIATTLLLVSAAIVILGLTWLLIFAREPQQEDFINEKDLQAVFINSNPQQVYFGDITGVTDEYIRLNNIYYLRVEQQVQPKTEGQPPQQQVSLAKLGCELHGPRDQMIINREQVLYWENLRSDGKVTEAVKKFVQANPEGQDCEPQQQQNGNGSSNGNGTTDDANGTTTNGTDDTTGTPPTTAPEEETTN